MSEISKDKNIDNVLKNLKKAKKTNARQKIFKEFLSRIEEHKIDLTGPRGCIDLSRVAGKGLSGRELAFRNRLLWLRTIPLSDDSCFIVLGTECGVYRKNKKGRYSADLLGLYRGLYPNKPTTMLAVAELKYGKKGDHLLYAIAEGLRNLYLHRQGLPRLSEGWKIDKDVTRKDVARNAWGTTNPFADLARKRVSLLIIGDDSWMEEQKELLQHLSRNPLAINLGGDSVKITIYSSQKRWNAEGKPYALLPLKKK